MLIDFFFTLRRHQVPVTIRELLDLVEGLKHRLVYSDVDEFYQVDDQASAKYRGAGLGLTLVHDLLVLIEGDSLLTSEAGVGTRVEFSVPVAVA